MRFEEPQEQERRTVINRGVLEQGQIVILFPEGECEVLKVSSIGAVVRPLAKRKKSFTAFKSTNPDVQSKDEIDVSFESRGRQFTISANSEIPVVI